MEQRITVEGLFYVDRSGDRFYDEGVDWLCPVCGDSQFSFSFGFSTCDSCSAEVDLVDPMAGSIWEGWG